VVAYDVERSMEYHLFLGAGRLEDLDIRKAPVYPVASNEDTLSNSFGISESDRIDAELDAVRRAAEDKAAWSSWSSILIQRLQLSGQGDLLVGPAKLMANGLSKNFCLTGTDTLGSGKGKGKGVDGEPSRVHITRFFGL
jgi:hypothetical protein